MCVSVYEYTRASICMRMCVHSCRYMLCVLCLKSCNCGVSGYDLCPHWLLLCREALGWRATKLLLLSVRLVWMLDLKAIGGDAL